ncbi:MAG: hypothetical protein AB7V56_08665, partial [Candidatus Nitrosocosmicus sp.]
MKESKSNFISKRLLCDDHIHINSRSMNLVFLFAGLFATILVFSSFSSFAFSLSNSTNNISKDNLINQSTTNLPFKTGAATNSKCPSNQIDIGGTCTSKAEVSKQIISITQGVMQKENAKGV